MEKELLYDPLFETPPDTVIRDTPGRGFWGKAAVKKTVFILILSLFVGVSITLSFSSLSKARFTYKETEDGYLLADFHANKTDSVLEVGPVFSEDGQTQPEQQVTAVREYAVCCNENTAFILIGKSVRDIPNTAFYSMSALSAVLVDPENPDYCAVDGVLYRQENGKPAELILYPARNYLYRALLTLGETPPANAEAAAALEKKAARLEEKCKPWLEAMKKDEADKGTFGISDAEKEALTAALSYDISAGVSRIGEMAFAECGDLFYVSIPEGVAEIASMAFFKCGELRELGLPDSLQTLGSDAFSYCAKLPEIFIPAGVASIGHHAFFGCDGAPEVLMECAEENAPDCGQNWLPQRRKLFMRNVPVVYNAETRNG